MDDFDTLGIDTTRALVVDMRQRMALGRFAIVSVVAICAMLSLIGIIVLSA